MVNMSADARKAMVSWAIYSDNGALHPSPRTIRSAGMDTPKNPVKKDRKPALVALVKAAQAHLHSGGAITQGLATCALRLAEYEGNLPSKLATHSLRRVDRESVQPIEHDVAVGIVNELSKSIAPQSARSKALPQEEIVQRFSRFVERVSGFDANP